MTTIQSFIQCASFCECWLLPTQKHRNQYSRYFSSLEILGFYFVVLATSQCCKFSGGQYTLPLLNLSAALKFSSKFFRKRSFFDQNQQPLNNVKPFERILRALFIAKCPYKFSSFLDLRNGYNRFRLFARDFRLFRFFFFGICMLFESGPPRKIARLS